MKKMIMTPVELQAVYDDQQVQEVTEMQDLQMLLKHKLAVKEKEEEEEGPALAAHECPIAQILKQDC
jgi:hypothetical protein